MTIARKDTADSVSIRTSNIRNHMTTIIRLLIVMAVSASLAACGGPSANDEALVYVAVPLSGFQANGGQTILGGVRLAAEEINRSGGAEGYKITVVPLDDESDNDVAVANVATIEEAIANGEKVLGVIGHLNSGQTLAAMDLYQNMDLVVITPTASEQSLTERDYTNFFRINANDAVQAKVDAGFLVNTLGASNVAVLLNNTEYGRGLAQSLIRNLDALGASTVAEIEVEEGQALYADEVQAVIAAAPDAIFYAGYEIEAPYLRAALVEAGVDAPMLASDGAFLAATIDEAAGTAEGMYVSAFAPSPRNVADDRWFEAYQAVEYRNPDTYSVNGYVAMQALAQGLTKAGSLDSDKIANALHGSAVDTLLGRMNFNDRGDVEDPQIWIYQVIDREFVQVD